MMTFWGPVLIKHIFVNLNKVIEIKSIKSNINRT